MQSLILSNSSICKRVKNKEIGEEQRTKEGKNRVREKERERERKKERKYRTKKLNNLKVW